MPWYTVAWTEAPQIGRLTDKQAPPAASALPGVLCLEDFPRGEERFLECCPGWQRQEVGQSGAGWRSPTWVPGLDALTSPSLLPPPPCSQPAPQLPLPRQMSSVWPALLQQATGPRLLGGTAPSLLPQAAQGGVSMDSHWGAR